VIGAFGFVVVVPLVALAACRAPARTETSEQASAPATPSPVAKVAPAPSAAAEPKNAEHRSAPVPQRSYAVAALGDSLTDFRSHGGGYLRSLRERCPESRFDSYGKGGDMVNQMRRRMATDLFDHAPVAYTHLIVFGGVNDLYSDLTAGRTVKKIAADLTKIYAAGHQHGMKIVAMTVAPWGGFKLFFTEARGETTRELNRWIIAQRGAGADFVVDTYPLLSCGDPQTLCELFFEPFHDGLHFGPPAHQKLADALFETVFSDCR
jgi:lysophospholipase L1-like esterase